MSFFYKKRLRPPCHQSGTQAEGGGLQVCENYALTTVDSKATGSISEHWDPPHFVVKYELCVSINITYDKEIYILSFYFILCMFSC
jgi:hypothetical protein